MSQQYFSDSEWATLVQSPVQAIVAMILADKTDPVSFLKEVQASIQILSTEVQRQDITNDLVKSLLVSLQDKVTTGETLQGEELLLKKEFELLGYIRTLTSADEGRKKAIAHIQSGNQSYGGSSFRIQGLAPFGCSQSCGISEGRWFSGNWGRTRFQGRGFYAEANRENTGLKSLALR
jgi:hypothetical protein